MSLSCPLAANPLYCKVDKTMLLDLQKGVQSPGARPLGLSQLCDSIWLSLIVSQSYSTGPDLHS